MGDSPYRPGRPRRWEKGKTKLPPGSAGEYRIVDKESGKPVYIGESGNLQARLNQHTRQTQNPTRTDKSSRNNPKKHRVDYQLAKPGASTEARRKHERSKIAQHKPPWNKDAGGSGRK